MPLSMAATDFRLWTVKLYSGVSLTRKCCWNPCHPMLVVSSSCLHICWQTYNNGLNIVQVKFETLIKEMHVRQLSQFTQVQTVCIQKFCHKRLFLKPFPQNHSFRIWTLKLQRDYCIVNFLRFWVNFRIISIELCPRSCRIAWHFPNFCGNNFSIESFSSMWLSCSLRDELFSS